MKVPWDTYNLRARYRPPLLAAMPLALVVVAVEPGGSPWWGAIWAVVTWCGGTALIAQLGRDLGKRKEPMLFGRWGAAPTTARLRHRAPGNTALVQRRHAQLAGLLPDLRFPSPKEEAADPGPADEVYEAAVVYLRERTRNREKFPLVFEENCNYGFRRNLWGMKPIGVGIALLAVAAVTVIASGRLGLAAQPAALAAVGALNLLVAVLWIFWFTPKWVKIAADAYADRLLGALDAM